MYVDSFVEIFQDSRFIIVGFFLKFSSSKLLQTL